MLKAAMGVLKLVAFLTFRVYVSHSVPEVRIQATKEAVHMDTLLAVFRGH